MPGSGLRVNFYLRPAKQIERRMLCEVFSRLVAFQPLETYRYVGFGAFYFVDFSLFHRLLGIRNMVSIESDPESAARCDFNRPLSCIRLELGESNEVLPRLDWDERTILWLDYDQELDASKLADVKTFCSSAPSGSVLILTLNLSSQFDQTENASPGNREANGRFERFKIQVGGDAVPPDISSSDIYARNLPETCRRIVNGVIGDVLGKRNGGLAPSRQLVFKQLFNFQYADAARMLTLGGLLHDSSGEEIAKACKFDDLSFVRSDDSAYVIKAPHLTYREIHHINSCLPSDDMTGLYTIVNALASGRGAAELQIEDEVFSKDLLATYAALYRYYPTFAELFL